ncbi:MAG: hypothetical protein RLZZ135_1700 [Cyanobacteriota bacterium]|jgi:hypothetical protein
MIIEDQSKANEDKLTATDCQLLDRNAAAHNTASNEQQFTALSSNEVENLPSPDPDAVISIEDQCKDLKENAPQSFQELEAPDSTLISIHTKAQEFKSNLEDKAKKTLDIH